jgi:dipeptidyl-peptidase-4
VLYGRLDWVYQEEVYGRGRWNGAWWSPDSGHLAYLRIDQTEVPTYPLADLTQQHPTARTMRYPKSGDPNPTARLFVSTPTGTPVEVDLSAYGDDVLIVRVGWTPDGKRLLFQVTDRIQTWLDLNTADPTTGDVTRLLHEESTSWVNIRGLPRWLDDGSFLWQSERTGFNHVYHYAADGRLLHTVTAGEWEVRRLLDVKGDTLWFTGSKDSAVERRAYRVKLDGTGFRALTPEPGSHSVRLNGDGSYLIDTFSSARVPSETRLLDGDGKLVRVLASAQVRALKTHVYSPVEMLKIPARDGFELDASLVRPPDFDARKVYPVWLPTYSGPNAPSVSHRWAGDAWTQFLAQRGILVLRVNVRSASGKGQVHTGSCYKQLGVQELRDLEDAVAWLTAHDWADAERVGISGWSYGGFMAAFALTHSKAFALGVAGAGVYDWRNYDTIYTERYMSTPALNPDGYAATSCIAAAKNLHGHLLVAHGTQDDNVHVQNALQFAFALQQAGKSFDLMLYPKSGHGLRTREQRRHHRQNTWDAIQRVLLRR